MTFDLGAFLTASTSVETIVQAVNSLILNGILVPALLILFYGILFTAFIAFVGPTGALAASSFIVFAIAAPLAFGGFLTSWFVFFPLILLAVSGLMAYFGV